MIQPSPYWNAFCTAKTFYTTFRLHRTKVDEGRHEMMSDDVRTKSRNKEQRQRSTSFRLNSILMIPLGIRKRPQQHKSKSLLPRHFSMYIFSSHVNYFIARLLFQNCRRSRPSSWYLKVRQCFKKFWATLCWFDQHSSPIDWRTL